MRDPIYTDSLTPLYVQVSGICSTYGIGSLVRIVKEIKGTANVNIKFLTKTGMYVMKVFTCEPERFEFIVRTLHCLQKNKIPVLMPLINKDGSHYIQLGEKLLQVTRYIPGLPYQYSTKQSLSSGRMLRRFHDTLSDISDIVRPVASLYPCTDTLLEGIALLKEMNETIPSDEIRTIIELYDEIAGKWDSSSPALPGSIVHGDWNQNNQSFDKFDELRCIMDFEFMTRVERIFDVAYFLWRISARGEELEIAQAFMNGYGPLTDNEIQFLPLEISRISYYYICTSIISPEHRHELPKHFESHYPFIKWVLSKDGQETIKGLCKR